MNVAHTRLLRVGKLTSLAQTTRQNSDSPAGVSVAALLMPHIMMIRLGWEVSVQSLLAIYC